VAEFAAISVGVPVSVIPVAPFSNRFAAAVAFAIAAKSFTAAFALGAERVKANTNARNEAALFTRLDLRHLAFFGESFRKNGTRHPNTFKPLGK